MFFASFKEQSITHSILSYYNLTLPDNYSVYGVWVHGVWGVGAWAVVSLLTFHLIKQRLFPRICINAR